MKRVILSVLALAASLIAAFAVETGCPATPLGWPFTAVVKDLKLYDSASIDGKTIGTVPPEVELAFRESEESEHWIYIDDGDRGVHGWCLDWGGFYGDDSNRDPDVSAYQNALDYAYVTLGHNPKAYQRDDSAVCDYDEEADEAAADAGSSVDAGYDDALDKAVASKASGRKYSSENGWDSFMKWVIIILIGIGVLTAWFPVLPEPFKDNAYWYLAAAGVAEIIYSLHWSVYASYGSNQLFSMFILGLVQILGLLFARHSSPAPRWCRWVSVAGMATVAITVTLVNGIGTILSSIVGGILNLVVGCVVLTVVYAFFKDGIDDSGRRSSDSSSGDTPKRNGTFDGCCDNCALWNSSTRRCGRYGNITSPNDHCNGHIWG